MKKGKEKRRKMTLKRGKGLKNASFWAINKTPEFMESVVFTDESTFEISMYTNKKVVL